MLQCCHHSRSIAELIGSHISPAPQFISLTDEDKYFHQRSDPDDPDMPPMINPWDQAFCVFSRLLNTIF